MANPVYGSIGFDPGVELSQTVGAAGPEYRGMRAGEDAFSVNPSDLGKYQQTFDMNGQTQVRLGYDPNGFSYLKDDPSVASWLQSNPNPYNSEYGFYAPEAINERMAQLNLQQKAKSDGGFWHKLGDMAGYGPIMLGLAGTGAALGGAFGAGAVGAEGVGANPAFISTLAQEAGHTASFADLLGGGAAGGAAGEFSLGGNPSQGLKIPGGAGTGGDFSLGGAGNPSLGLQPETVGGAPFGAETMGAGGTSSGAAGLGSQPGFMDRIMSGFSDFASDPMSFIKSLAQQALPGNGGGGNNNGGFFNNGPFNTAAGIGSLLQGGYGLLQSNKLKKALMQMASSADPQGPYRSGYASQLNSLMNNPSSITSDPGYQAGMEAVQRSMNAQGYQGSGNMMAALAKYGGGFFNDAVTRLLSLAGGNPQGAATIGAEGTIGSTNLAGQAMNSLGYGAGRLLLNNAFMR